MKCIASPAVAKRSNFYVDSYELPWLLDKDINESPTIVFDGYSGASTKDMEHLRRGCYSFSQDIEFTPQTTLLSKKNEFFNNEEKKKDLLPTFVVFLKDHAK